MAKRAQRGIATDACIHSVTSERLERRAQSAMVCFCLGLRRGAIVNAIRQQQLHTVEQIRARLLASSRCGGCISSIRKLLLETKSP